MEMGRLTVRCSRPSVPAASDEKAEAMETFTKLVRSRRNVPVVAVPQFKRLPDFWGWYKYFMDTHNQEGVSRVTRFHLSRGRI